MSDSISVCTEIGVKSGALLQHATNKAASALNQFEAAEDTVTSVWRTFSCYAVPSCICILISLHVVALLYTALRIFPKTDNDLKEPKQSSSRNAHFDNAKFLGMTLVCWSHIGVFHIGDMWKNFESGDVIWFHMPLFVFLSGSFVRPFSWQGLLKTVITLGFPLLFFTLVINPLNQVLVERSLFSGNLWLKNDPYYEDSMWSLLTGSGPSYFIWFLRSLILWRLVTMFTCTWPKALHIALAVASGLLSIYWPPASPNRWYLGFFAYQRTLSLFPFYVMGQHLDIRGLLEAIPAPRSSCILFVWFTLMSLIYLENHPRLWHRVTFGVFDILETEPVPFLSYPDAASCPLDYRFMWARYFSCLTYRTVTMLIFLFFGVPRSTTWFTEAGSKTIYSYLLHFPFVKLANFALCWLANRNNIHPEILPRFFQYFGFITFCCLLNLYFMLVVYGLTTPPVQKLFGPFIEPTWLLKMMEPPSLPKKEVE